MWCAPGNAGIAEERLAKNGAPVECVNLGAEELPKLLAFGQEKKPDLTVAAGDRDVVRAGQRRHRGGAAREKWRAGRVREPGRRGVAEAPGVRAGKEAGPHRRRPRQPR